MGHFSMKIMPLPGSDLGANQQVTSEMLDYVCVPVERDRLTATADTEAYIATLAFSAKEAFYKAYFPTARVFLEFTDVELEVDWQTRSFVVSLCSTAAPDIAGRRRFQGRFRLIGPYIVTAVWVAVPARLASVET